MVGRDGHIRFWLLGTICSLCSNSWQKKTRTTDYLLAKCHTRKLFRDLENNLHQEANCSRLLCSRLMTIMHVLFHDKLTINYNSLPCNKSILLICLFNCILQAHLTKLKFIKLVISVLSHPPNNIKNNSKMFKSDLKTNNPEPDTTNEYTWQICSLKVLDSMQILLVRVQTAVAHLQPL